MTFLRRVLFNTQNEYSKVSMCIKCPQNYIYEFYTAQLIHFVHFVFRETNLTIWKIKAELIGPEEGNELAMAASGYNSKEEKVVKIINTIYGI